VGDSGGGKVREEMMRVSSGGVLQLPSDSINEIKYRECIGI
jgi:hypothetical protein